METLTLSRSAIRAEYQQRYRELCEQYGAEDIWQTRGLDDAKQIIWVAPREELWRLEEWNRQQYERLRAVEIGTEKATEKALAREAEIQRREAEKASGRAEREARRANRPVFIGNDCRVCRKRIEPTGKRGRPAVVHEDCKALYKAQQAAEYEASRCQDCRHEKHEGKICGVTVIQAGTSRCQCEGEIVDMS